VPARGLSRSAVEFGCDAVELALGVLGEVGALRASQERASPIAVPGSRSGP
jgi:hypothetical protein